MIPRRAAAAQAQRRRNVGRAPTGDGLPRVGRLPAALGRRTGTAARPPTAAAAAAAAEQLLAFFFVYRRARRFLSPVTRVPAPTKHRRTSSLFEVTEF